MRAPEKVFLKLRPLSVCSVSSVLKSLDLPEASVHDILYLKDVREWVSNCIITGNQRLCIEGQQQLSLFGKAAVHVDVPIFIYQKEEK